MRARENIASPRDFEGFLRKHGFTRGEAKAIASLSWKAVAELESKRRDNVPQRRRKRPERKRGCDAVARHVVTEQGR